MATAVTPASEIEALTGDPNFMSSLARGLAVIRAFSQQRRLLTIAQLSHRTDIPRAAVRRCLYTLGKLGYIGTEDGRTYALRPRILALGHAHIRPLHPSGRPVGADGQRHLVPRVAGVVGTRVRYEHRHPLAVMPIIVAEHLDQVVLF